MFKKFILDESGATAIEYTLIAAAMSLVLVTIMPTLTKALSGSFATISSHVSTGT